MLILLTSLFLYACDASEGNNTMPPTTVTVDIGQPGELFLNSNDLPSKGTVDRQPAGLNFFRVRWSTAAPGTVVVNHGQHSFDIPFALTLLGTEDTEALHEGDRKSTRLNSSHVASSYAVFCLK